MYSQYYQSKWKKIQSYHGIFQDFVPFYRLEHNASIVSWILSSLPSDNGPFESSISRVWEIFTENRFNPIYISVKICNVYNFWHSKKKINNLNIILIAIWSSVWVVQYFYVCIRIITEIFCYKVYPVLLENSWTSAEKFLMEVPNEMFIVCKYIDFSYLLKWWTEIW